MILRELLTKFKAGELPVEQVEAHIEGLGEPFYGSTETLSVGPNGRLDPGRATRSRVPEAVFAEGKWPEDTIECLRLLAAKNGSALAARVSPDLAALARTELNNEFDLDYDERARTLVVKKSDHVAERLGRWIGILAAGTVDVPVAEEAEVTAELMGCRIGDGIEWETPKGRKLLRIVGVIYQPEAAGHWTL